MGSKMASILQIVLLTFLFIGSNQQKIDTGAEDQNFFYQRSPDVVPTLDEFRKELLYPHLKDDLTRIKHSISLHDEPLTFRLPFFGFDYRYIWVHKDGYLLFNYGLNKYPDKIVFPTPHINNPEVEQDPSLISPWFSRQDIPSMTGAGIYFRKISMDSMNRNDPWEDLLYQRIKLDFQDGMIGAGDFEPHYAIIATWRNVTHAANVNQDPGQIKTNTYQAVIATDEKRTYAMFNYDQIQWISEKDVFGGEKGTPPFIGFNAGNRTRAYEYEPYSQQQRVKDLPALGYGNGLNGRFFFQINEEIWPGCCIERELDFNYKRRPQLTFFPRYGSMLGGTLVNITGPCFFSPYSVYKCRFDTQEVKAEWRSKNHVTCIMPPVIYHGYVDLTVSIDDGQHLFGAKFYVQPPDMVDPDVTVLDDSDREENPRKMVLQWFREKLTWSTTASVTISLWGYREENTILPELVYIDVLEESVSNGALHHELDLENLRNRWNTDKLDIQFGFIAINITNPASIKGGIKSSPILWSRPMPLAWYFAVQWRRKIGKDWKREMCEDWYEREKYGDPFAITLFRCPCTKAQAVLDRGRFAPDLQCNEIDRKCQTFHRTAEHCVRSGRPAIGGAGQLCCYDDRGELIRTGDMMYGGRPSRSFHYGKHPFKQKMMIPALSYWLHDVVPFFYCCKWAGGEDDSESCDLFKYWRTSQDCSLYQPPGVASAFGDPHFVTFDRVNYTFNGKGEFVLTRVNHREHKLDVQARFEQPVSKHKEMHHINGTRLSAVVAKDNVSHTVEFRLRPESARWLYHLYIIVDGMYVYFWDNSMRIQYFPGVTLFQPTKVYNMSHIVAMFDSGAGVEVMVENDQLGVHVYLPITYMNKTAGLLGNWSRVIEDEFSVPYGDPMVRPGPTTTLRDIHKKFGMEWRLTENDKDRERIGKSLFLHDPIQFTEFDNASFVPDFDRRPMIQPGFPYKEETVETLCSQSAACLFDFIVTGDLDFAITTKLHENYAQTLASGTRERVVRCPELPKPRHGTKSEIRYFTDTVVRFSCDDGYRLVGYQYRKCRDTGLWSWGVDAECISEADYNKKIAGISVGIIIPLLIIGGLTCFCIVAHLRQRRDHRTGEIGDFGPTQFVPMKNNFYRNGQHGLSEPTTSTPSPQSSDGTKKLEDEV